jgi:hypothetical protein
LTGERIHNGHEEKSPCTSKLLEFGRGINSANWNDENQ